MNQPLNLDDPRFTDYALGEMNAAEREEFEALLQDHPVARKELDATRDLVALLSDGLDQEWRSELEPEPVFEVIDGGRELEREKVVEVEFTQTPAAGGRPVLLSLAAVLTGLLVVGAVTLSQRGTGQNFAGSNEGGWSDPSEPLLATVETDGSSAPSVFLVRELAQLERSVDWGNDSQVLSPFYLAGAKVNASFSSGSAMSSGIVSDYDWGSSYLPAETGGGQFRLASASSQPTGLPVAGSYLAGQVSSGDSFSIEEAFEMDSFFSDELPVWTELDLPAEEAATPSNLKGKFDRLQEELQSIVSEIDASGELSDEHLEGLKQRLHHILEEHREIGGQINEGF